MRSDDDLGFITLTGIGHADLSRPMSVNFVNKTDACREVYLMTVRLYLRTWLPRTVCAPEFFIGALMLFTSIFYKFAN